MKSSHLLVSLVAGVALSFWTAAAVGQGAVEVDVDCDAGGTAVFLIDSRVQHNGLEGVSVETGVFEVNDSEIADNEVGIDAIMGRIVLNEGTSIVNNRSGGVIGNLHTSIVANGPVWIERNGEHGVRLALDSGFLTVGDVSINDNGWFDVKCKDRESSAKFEDQYPGRVWCSDFRW